MTMKRAIKGEVEEGELDSSNRLMSILSKVVKISNKPAKITRSMVVPTSSRVFRCKTCSQEFLSFQALGGHRASHNKPRLTDRAGGERDFNTQLHEDKKSSNQNKRHECSICGAEFAIGQALGGHMRRHRGPVDSCYMNQEQGQRSLVSPVPVKSLPIMKMSSSRSTRVFGVDLSLTPDIDNELKLHMFL